MNSAYHEVKYTILYFKSGYVYVVYPAQISQFPVPLSASVIKFDK